MIPGYLTLPAGVADPHGFAAVVWLAQFFAARGFVVLQPNFRGSAGFGDEWFEHNGFKSWEIAVADVVAAGRWLVSAGIADPSNLGIIGIAPVTDLAALKEERRHWSDFAVTSEFIGEGTHMRDGSPITHARQFTQPVLLFHGTSDRNVSVEQSRRMQAALKAAGANSRLVTYDERDHQLEDSAVRADMLRQSDAFLRRSFGMSPQ